MSDYKHDGISKLRRIRKFNIPEDLAKATEYAIDAILQLDERLRAIEARLADDGRDDDASDEDTIAP